MCVKQRAAFSICKKKKYIFLLTSYKLTSSCSGFDVREKREPLYFGLSSSPEKSNIGF